MPVTESVVVMKSPPSQYAAIEKMPSMSQAQHLVELFGAARTAADYEKANEAWLRLKPRFEVLEKKFECEGGRDSEIAIDIVEDLVGKPVELIIALSRLVLEFAAQDKDAAYKALEDALKELPEYVWDKLKEATGDKAQKEASKAFPKLREALIDFLKQYSKRSRVHFRKLIGAAAGTLKAIGGTTVVAFDLITTSSKIRADECGDLERVSAAQRNAMMRIFATQSPAPLKLAPIR